MNDQCHDCKIRKLCYLEEPEEDWTCDHYEPCEYDEEDVTDINIGNKDTISRHAAIDALTKDKKALEHIINGMSGYEKEFDRLVGQRNQVDYDIYAIEQLPPAQPEIIRCKDCDWWTKQDDSPQGRCALMGMYPTGGWFCGNAKRREVTT